jgi:hypothetical protein
VQYNWQCMSRCRLRVLLLPLALLLAPPAPAAAQDPPPVSPPAGQPPVIPADGQRLRVYLDCDCFSSYLRDEIDWVDFVRQPQDADVHLLSSSRDTGGGGRELTLRFVGAGAYDDVDQELKVVTLTGETENVRREAVLRTVTVGLLNYLARRGLPAELELDVEAGERAGVVRGVPASDPWNLWVFSVRGSASLEEDENNREVNWDVRVSGDRVTEDWKLSFGASADLERETFNRLEDPEEPDEQPFSVTQRERDLDWFAAKSLGPHWSLGLDGNLESSTFGNTRFSTGMSPAVEFSVFPYADHATRQLLVQYEVGVEHARYNEVTIFDKLRETLWRHELSARFDQRQTWGSIDARLEWSQYLHDRTKYRLEADGELSFRIVRGLTVNFEANASRIRDQLSLPRRDATPEEILLRLRELQSGYEYRFSTGFTYSFGSIYNNVVNPRFGGGGGGDRGR